MKIKVITDEDYPVVMEWHHGTEIELDEEFVKRWREVEKLRDEMQCMLLDAIWMAKTRKPVGHIEQGTCDGCGDRESFVEVQMSGKRYCRGCLESGCV